MKKYKITAAVGTVIMGISSFASCLAETASVSFWGNGGLLLSIVIMTYAFKHWQP